MKNNFYFLLFCSLLFGSFSAFGVINSVEQSHLKFFQQDMKTKKIYAPDGSVYVLVGKYKAPKPNSANITDFIERDCRNALFYGDPAVPPPDDLEPGLLPDGSCVLHKIVNGKILKEPVKILTHDINVSEKNNKKSLKKKLGCRLLNGYAPPMVYSPYVPIGAAIGPASWSVSVTPISSGIEVLSVDRFHDGHGWQERSFTGSTIVTQANVAASIYLKNKGIPFGTALRIMVCP